MTLSNPSQSTRPVLISLVITSGRVEFLSPVYMLSQLQYQEANLAALRYLCSEKLDPDFYHWKES